MIHHYRPLCHNLRYMQIQIRQAELEQINVELSIGITERQREISRLKLQQEQVTCSTLLYSTLLYCTTTHRTTLHYTILRLTF